MPWKETCTMDQRIEFIAAYLSGCYTKRGLCMHYGISRPTGDKWIERYHSRGPEGLRDLSRRPHRHPYTTAPEIAERIVQMKLVHLSFGPKKVMDRLRALEPKQPWPADSTAAASRRTRAPWSPAAPRHRVGAPTSRATSGSEAVSAATP